MKTLLALALLAVGISSSVVPKVAQVLDYPHFFADDATSEEKARAQERFVSDSIISAIEDFSKDIVNAGLDPLHVERENASFALPVPILFNAGGFVENLRSNGLSNIVVNSMAYSVLFSRLNFDISMPHISFSLGAGGAEATLFGNKLEGLGDGSIDITDIRIIGEVRVSIGIISGISVSTVRVDFRVGNIRSSIRLLVQDRNWSEEITNFVSSTVPQYLNEYRSEINELIEIILKDAINENL